MPSRWLLWALALARTVDSSRQSPAVALAMQASQRERPGGRGCELKVGVLRGRGGGHWEVRLLRSLPSVPWAMGKGFWSRELTRSDRGFSKMAEKIGRTPATGKQAGGPGGRGLTQTRVGVGWSR